MSKPSSVPIVPVIAGLALLASLNGIPGVNLTALDSHGSFRYTDVCILLLVALAGWRRLTQPLPLTDRRLRAYAWWGLALGAMWLFAVYEAVSYGASLSHSALYGRDFLYFAILGPLAPWLVVDERELLALVTTLVIGTVVFVLCEIPAALGLISASIVNPDLTTQQAHFTRIYTFMGDANLIDLVFCGAAAYALLLSGRRAWVASAVATLCLLGMLLLLTRALYLGLLVSLVLVSLLWGARAPTGPRVRRRLGGVIAGLLIMGACALVVAPGVYSGPASAVTQRITQGLTNVATNSGSVGVRASASGIILHALGGRWPLGLGFRDPTAYYVVGLPLGGIEDVDVSGLNSVVTMGLVGAALVFLPAVAALVAVVRRFAYESRYTAVYLGLSLWLVSAAASSATLGPFDTTTGIVNACVAIGVLLRVMSWDDAYHAESGRAREGAQPQSDHAIVLPA